MMLSNSCIGTFAGDGMENGRAFALIVAGADHRRAPATARSNGRIRATTPRARLGIRSCSIGNPPRGRPVKSTACISNGVSRGVRAVRGAGISSPRDLLEFRHDGFWRRRLLLYAA